MLRIGTQGGGGFGDPLERPAAKVATDVADGFVRRETALRDYGVVLTDDGSVDEAATRTQREAIRKGRGWSEPPLYGLGAAREAHSALWTEAIEDAIAAAVDGMPVQLRQFLHRRLMDAVAQRLEAGDGVAAAEIPGLLASLRGSLGVHGTAAE